MPGGTSYRNIADLTLGTLAKYDRKNWTLLANNLQKYVFLPWLMKNQGGLIPGKPFQIQEKTGTSCEWDVQYRHSDSAGPTQLYAPLSPNVVATMARATVDWFFANTYYTFEERELAINKGEEVKLFDMLATRSVASMIALAEYLEAELFGKPVDSNDADKSRGIEYYVVENAAATSGGFNGRNPSGFANCAGIDSSSATYAGWRNYNDAFAAMSLEDWVRKVRRMLKKIDFRLPIGEEKIKKFMSEDGANYVLWSGEEVQTRAEDVLFAANDSVGNDLAKYDDKGLLRRIPITWIPQLDGKARHKTYALNMKTWKLSVLEGENLRRKHIEPTLPQYRTHTIVRDLSWALECHDRRPNGVITGPTISTAI